MGMGERYDAIVTAGNPGAWPLIAGPVDSVVPGVVARFVYLVDPMMGALELEFETNNPGRWLFHCHHLYHMEAGMARVLEY